MLFKTKPAMPPLRILVIHNPVSGRPRSRLLHRVLARLASDGVDTDVRATTQRGDAERIARDFAMDGYDAIAVAGGDGTIGEVANGLPEGAPPLAIIPLGTANVLAAEIGLPRRAGIIAATITRGHAREVYTGRVNGSRFLLMAGAGLDAEVVRAVDPVSKRRWGKFAYAFATWRQMWRYGYPALTVIADGREYSAVTAVACKGRRYGGPHMFAPGADLARPDFELVLFRRGGPFWVSVFGIALVLGLIRHMPGIDQLRAVKVEIRGPEGAPVQGDGDDLATLPAAIEIDPQRLRILYPPD